MQQTLQKKRKERHAGRCIFCSLIRDDVSIKKSVEWNGQKFTGYVDLGGVDDDTLPPATGALAFMDVAVNANWKCTIGYFFVHGLGDHLVCRASSK